MSAWVAVVLVGCLALLFAVARRTIILIAELREAGTALRRDWRATHDEVNAVWKRINANEHEAMNEMARIDRELQGLGAEVQRLAAEPKEPPVRRGMNLEGK